MYVFSFFFFATSIAAVTAALTGRVPLHKFWQHPTRSHSDPPIAKLLRHRCNHFTNLVLFSPCCCIVLLCPFNFPIYLGDALSNFCKKLLNSRLLIQKCCKLNFHTLFDTKCS